MHARPRAGRGPGRAGPSPDSEGGGAGRGRQRTALPTTRAVLSPLATARGGGAAAGGSGTPRHPLRSLEKTSSPRARRPHQSAPIGPTEARGDTRGCGGPAARGGRRQVGAFAVRATSPRCLGLFPLSASPGSPERYRDPVWLGSRGFCESDERGNRHATTEAPAKRRPSEENQRHAAGSARHDRSRAHTSPPQRGRVARAQPSQGPSRHAVGRPGTRPPPREDGHASLTDTAPWLHGHTTTAVTRGSRCKRETTAPLGLRQLRGDPERSRGTTEDRSADAHAPRRHAARWRHGPPHHGEGRPRDTQPGGLELEHPTASQRPRPHRRRETEGGGARSGRIPHPCLPHTADRRGGEARGPWAEREERPRSP